MKDIEEEINQSMEKFGRYFVNPADADMKPMRDWMRLKVDLGTLIEVSPVENDEGEIIGFAMHIDIKKFGTFKKFHPVIESMIAKATKDMVLAAMQADSKEERNSILDDAKKISEVMLKYYSERESDDEVLQETADTYEDLEKITAPKPQVNAPSSKTVH